MKNKYGLGLGVICIAMCIFTTVNCILNPSAFKIIIVIVESVCVGLGFSLWIKKDGKSIEFKGLSIKEITKYIPGFRSGKKVNKIVASIYYIFILLMVIFDLIVGFQWKIIGIAFQGLLIPFILFYTAEYMNHL